MAEDSGTWWAAFPSLGDQCLAEMVEEEGARLSDLLAEGEQGAIRKFTHQGDRVQRRLFALLYAAVHAEGHVARVYGERGDTHERVSRAMGRGRDYSARWLKAGDRSWIKSHDLVRLLAGESFCPPVRRWLVEQLGLELGYVIAADAADEVGAAETSSGVESHVVDVSAAVGRLASSVSEARAGGIDRGEARECLTRVDAAISELTEMRSGLLELIERR